MKIAVVTGSSKGIGSSIAKYLNKKIKVILNRKIEKTFKKSTTEFTISKIITNYI